MNKSELARRILDKNPDDIKSIAAAERIVESGVDAICEELAAGGRVSIWGFGSLGVEERGARMVRNPRTKQVSEIGPHKVIRFKVGKALKDIIR